MFPLFIIGFGLLFITLSTSSHAAISTVDQKLAKVDPRAMRRSGTVIMRLGVPYRVLLRWLGGAAGSARDLRLSANQRAIARELTDQGALGVEVASDGDGSGWVSYQQTPKADLAVTFGTNVYGSGALYAVIREDGEAWL
jgi:hypothetical protein